MHSSGIFLLFEAIFTLIGVAAFCYYLSKPLNTPVWIWYQYMSVAITIWTVGQLLISIMVEYFPHLFLLRLLTTITYLGIVPLAPFWLMCCLYYCGYERLAENRNLRWALILYSGLFFFAILTDELTGLMFANFGLKSPIVYCPLMYFFTFCSYVIMGAASFAIIEHEYRRKGGWVWEITTLVAALLSLPVANVIAVIFPSFQMKLVPVAFVIDWVVFYLLALKYRYFNILPIALEAVFSTITYPVLVLGRDYSIKYANRVVREAHSVGENDLDKLTLADIFPQNYLTLMSAVKAINQGECETDEGVFCTVNHKKRYLRYTMREMNFDNIMAIIVDVTEYHELLENLRKYNEEMEMLNQELEFDTERLRKYVNAVTELIRERERQNVMRGIHDEMNDMLRRVESNFEAAQESNDKALFEENVELSYSNLQEVRRIVREMTNIV